MCSHGDIFNVVQHYGALIPKLPSYLSARHCNTCAVNSPCVLTARESGRIVLAPEFPRGENR